MKRLTSLPLIAVVLHAFVGCTRSAERDETGDMLDTGGAESSQPRGGATASGSGDPDPETAGVGERPSTGGGGASTGGVGGRPSVGGAPNPETGGAGERPSTGGGGASTGGVGGRPSVGGAPNPETGGAGERPSSTAECVSKPSLVGACVIDSEGPFDYLRVEQLTPDAGVNSEVRSIEFAFDATVTDRGTASPTADCWSYDNFATTRGTLPDGDVTFVDLEDQGGKEWRLELILPEYDASRFSIGDAVNVDVLVWEDGDEFNYRAGARYRIGRGEELLALVVESEESDVAVTPGTETCYVGEEDAEYCGQSQYDMLASHDGEQVEIADGETSEVGGLLVTNDQYVRYYDFGNCNFAGPAFTLGAQPAD